MKKAHYSVLVAAVLFLIAGGPARTGFAAQGNKKILVAYFSHTGNTREIANQVHKKVGGDIFEIQAAKPYPPDYHTVVNIAKMELEEDYKPELKTKIKNIKQYDIIFIGYPIWWGTYPSPVKTFLSDNDFSGKTIAPFCTHGGSGLGKSVSDVAKLCPKSTLLEGLAVSGNSAKTAQNTVTEWLKKIKVIKQ